MQHIFYSFCIAIIGLLPSYVAADTLELTDGTRINGEIIIIEDKAIVISTSIGEISFNRDNILKIYDIGPAILPSSLKSGTLSTQVRQQFADTIDEANLLDSFKQYPHGLTAGLLLGNGIGLFTAFDHTLSIKTQLHIQYESKSSSFFSSDTSISDYPKMAFAISDISAHKIMATYRYFPSTSSGLYLGSGAGIAKSRFTLERIESSDYSDPLNPIFTTYDFAYHSELYGAFIVGEFGFQSSRSVGKNYIFYANIGLQLAKFVYTKDSFDVNDLKASPFTNEINNLHDKQKNISQLVAGFGFYF